MIRNLDIVDRLPGEMLAMALADEYLSDVACVMVEKGNVALELARQQAVITTRGGKVGAAVIILQLMADDELPEVRFGPMTLKPSIQVLEQVELNNGPNGTKKSYRKIARRLIQIFKAARLDGLTTDWECDKPAIEPVAFKDDKGKALGNVVGCQVNFLTREADTEELEQVAAPTFGSTVEDSTPKFTLSSTTEGADIWYTTDDSVPMPGTSYPQGTAQAYSSPVEIPAAGVWVRAVAVKAGLIMSTISRAFEIGRAHV